MGAADERLSTAQRRAWRKWSPGRVLDHFRRHHDGRLLRVYDGELGTVPALTGGRPGDFDYDDVLLAVWVGFYGPGPGQRFIDGRPTDDDLEDVAQWVIYTMTKRTGAADA